MKDRAKSQASAPLVRRSGRTRPGAATGQSPVRGAPHEEATRACQSPLGPLAAVFGGSPCSTQRTA